MSATDTGHAMQMSNPQQLIRPDILALKAYHVQPAANMVKLDAMENPFALPPALCDELGDTLGKLPVNRYPDASYATLKACLRKAFGLPDGMRLLLGNGSDEIIQILAMAVAKPGAAILSVEPSFVMYRMIATFCNMRYVGVPLKADFTLDINATLAAIEREQPALVFLAYPNNPTGNHFEPAEIERIIRATPGLVVIDEAYQAFARDSFLPRLAEFDNVLVMRTVSKLGLAGLRLGYLVGAPQWLDELEKLRLPYNINVLTQHAAETVLGHIDVLNEQTQVLREERAKLFTALTTLPYIETFPSDANFILVRVPDANAVNARLREQGILIKNLDAAHPSLKNCLRLTVGAPEENQMLFEALKSALI